MERKIYEDLLKWKKEPARKPLLLYGNRQIGKTYTIEKFGKENFEEYLYFNLEKDKEVRNIFENTIDESKILEQLELYLGKKIDLDKTLFFFDEVQKSENFIVSLKYFNESEKPYKIVCAGSLLRC
jgi:predicted AAA+ superfamily ATPase